MSTADSSHPTSATHPAMIACCGKCGRSAALSAQGERFWCGWCSAETDVRLQPGRVLAEAATAPDAEHHLPAAPENVPLQPLRIPAGWRVQYNNGLYALQPTPQNIHMWWLFKQDMLVLVHDQRKRLLDLGWSPEMDYEQGRFRLALHDGLTHDGDELSFFETRDLAELVAEIECILDAVACGRL